jgi:nitrogen fixation NifU-like protein
MPSLYQDLILDHYRNPRNHGRLEHRTHHAKARNPTCGDELTMDIKVKNDKLEAVRFEGVGCAISQASASLLTEAIVGMKVDDVRALGPDFIFKFLGISLSPGRIKCGLLPLEAVQKALNIKIK